MQIWWLVVLSVVVVLVAILGLRLHAFLTLLLTAWLVAALSPADALDDHARRQIATGEWTTKQADRFVDQPAIDRVVESFGETAGSIGVLIALASVIGGLLLESGAASTIVTAMLRLTGPKRIPEALALSSFVLAIPVFFDTVFYLMMPLAQSLRRRLGNDYVLFILAILAGGSITHSLVPPTPGPLQVAKLIGVDVGAMLIAGLAIGSVTSCISLAMARLINRLVRVDLPIQSGEDPAHADTPGDVDWDRRDRRDVPSLALSLLPIAVPVMLIGGGAIADYAIQAGHLSSTVWTRSLLSISDKNIAIAIGCALSFLLMRYCRDDRKSQIVGGALSSAGGIILITAAGGAFGAMLRQAGIAQAIAGLAVGVPGMWLLPLAFIVTASIRTLQGSATVAMITAAGVLQGFATSGELPYHPVYLAMAIGAGSKPVSWLTDSAFWVITRMSGMTESEGLKTISPMSTAMGLSALIVTMIFARLIPAT